MHIQYSAIKGIEVLKIQFFILVEATWQTTKRPSWTARYVINKYFAGTRIVLWSHTMTARKWISWADRPLFVPMAPNSLLRTLWVENPSFCSTFLPTGALHVEVLLLCSRTSTRSILTLNRVKVGKNILTKAWDFLSFKEVVDDGQLEIVFVSSDRSSEAMLDYMKESHGKWLALEYGSGAVRYIFHLVGRAYKSLNCPVSFLDQRLKVKV